MTSNLGIDVSKATLDAVLLREDQSAEAASLSTPARASTACATSQEAPGTALHVCLEATGYYGDELAQFLYEAGYIVSVVIQRASKPTPTAA